MGKSLKNIIPDFSEAIYETHSGEESLNKYLKPLLENANVFYRVASFFTPSVIKKIFLELSSCLQKGGDVKFVIGIHDSEKLIPILDKISGRDNNSRFINAVEELISGQLNDVLKIIETNDDFLMVFSELVHQNHIKIKIATVRKDYDFFIKNKQWPLNQSIFHAKTSILKDDNDSVIIGGTINFSNSGYGDNVEDVVILGSWFSPKACQNSEDQFNEIWENEHKDSYTFEFGESIRKIILSMSEKSDKIQKKIISTMNKSFDNSHLLFLIENSPLFFHHSFQQVKLLPHQTEVYRVMLSRWPINGLIADEVGLGKTIEAGAIIKYLKKFNNIKRSALLVPSSLRYQWQREMFNLFGLKYYVYDSNSKSLIFRCDDEKEIITNINQDNFFENGVESIIFSWHYLRLRGSNGKYRIDKSDNLDLVLVDEAHAARKSESLTSDSNGTQLHQFLSSLLPNVKHKMLLTATPYQTSLLDYQSILELLLLHNDIDDNSFERIRIINSGRSLTTTQKISGMLEILGRKTYNPIDEITINNEEDPRELLSSFNEEFYIKNHPTTVLTIRNTREQLKQIGYEFPDVSVNSNPISLSRKQAKIFDRVNEYIETQLFNFETSVRGSAGLGFIKTIYQQRIVSSFKACFDTLNSRHNTLKLHLENGYVEGDLIEVENDDDDTSSTFSVFERIELDETQIYIAETEIMFIREILDTIQKILYFESHLQDPKIDRAIEIIKQHLKKNESIILFSRFTSTTNYLVDRLKSLNQFSFGRYQGDFKELIIEGTSYSHNKDVLSDKFTNGEFPVIVCSDAASEGLNLQRASVLINVDVPWNPARLLQRFGRIDRFGQKKHQLYFYNLYYPNSVEDRIYTRLIDRNIGFREILGTTPPITSQDHIIHLTNSEFLDSRDVPNYMYKNSLINLKTEDNIRIHDQILKLINESKTIKVTNIISNNRDQIQEGIIQINDTNLRFATDEMDKDYLNLNHKFLSHIATKYAGKKTSLHHLKNKKHQLLFYCIIVEEMVYPLISITQILEYLILDISIKTTKNSYCFDKHDVNNGVLNFINQEQAKVVNHNFINFEGNSSDMYEGLMLEETEVQITVDMM